MGWSGKDKHRDRDPGARQADEPTPGNRVFRLPDADREAVAACLRRIDEARAALEARQDPQNRQIIRDLRAAADRVFDLLNDLEDLGPDA
jgi:hypothetical protein